MRKFFCAFIPFLCVIFFGISNSGCTKPATMLAPRRDTGSHTILGCYIEHGLSVSDVNAIDAEAVRIIIPGGLHLDTLLNLASHGNFPPLFQNIEDLAKAGIKVVVTISWNYAAHGTPLPVPNSATYNDYVNAWNSFIKLMGPFLFAVVEDNEPQHDYAVSDLLPQSDGTIPAINWFQTLASNAHNLITQNPDLKYLLVCAPALDDVTTFENPFEHVFFIWANADPNIDMMDFHSHVTSANDILNLFSYVVRHTSKKIITTEWSQSKIALPWLTQQIDQDFAAAHGISSSLTNEDFITQCYSIPVDMNTWNAFMATAPYSEDFISNSFSQMESFGVLAAFYGSYQQSGDPHFDTDKLFASLTVTPIAGIESPPNYLFLQWYTALAKTLH